ncbi:serine hydrolase [Hymenobacter chitinivorans]|uniref:Putative secreted protein (Por secretion system target) n=1 Tax=Hymenobacter chitinivorans DSM 11115 TaxID=1121954 RepID=A0A2M9BL38_9BACT|nr:serine hydrolase [Hymenobacter chitinivorans]PJJ58635.1 putative secreted protein (Por secretion system target) [Hymenobacter chitinivorans DSM 11115]
MKYVVLLPVLWLLLWLWPKPATAQQLYFPPPTGNTWATVSPQTLGWCPAAQDSLLGFLGRKNTKSFLILKDGRLALEHYFGTYTQDSVWYWASAGKSLTAVLVGLAQQEGLLSIEDTTSRFLGRGWTSAPAAKERLIRLRHQLTMTTGLDDTPPAPCDNESSTPACLRYRTDAGTRWAYHTGAYRLLQDEIARTSNLTSTQFTTQRLGSRIGLSGVWYNYVFYSRARDMARFGLFILARGSWNGTPILRDTAYFRRMTTPSQPLNRSYGYLWWLNGQSSYMLPQSQLTFSGPLVPTAPADMLAALGKNDQKIYVVPSLGLVVVRQGQSAEAPKLAVSSFDTELWRYIMNLYCRPLATSAARAAAVQLYPNPARGQVHIQFQTAAPGQQLRCLDLLGREMLRSPLPAAGLTLSAAPWPAGLYLVQVLDARGTVLGTQRLVKQP